MSQLGIVGIRGRFPREGTSSGTEYVVGLHPLRRVLAFRGRSIDDVVNNPIAKNEVIGYFKLQKHIERVSQNRDLERQWNSTA